MNCLKKVADEATFVAKMAQRWPIKLADNQLPHGFWCFRYRFLGKSFWYLLRTRFGGFLKMAFSGLGLGNLLKSSSGIIEIVQKMNAFYGNVHSARAMWISRDKPTYFPLTSSCAILVVSCANSSGSATDNYQKEKWYPVTRCVVDIC